MQKLVAQFPELIAEGDGDLLLVRREQPVPDSVTGGGRWSLDHLFVTRGAIPVLVELKRAGDTRLRREVVGQLLDYAANGTAYWRPGDLAEAFAATCEAAGNPPDVVLAEFLGDQPTDGFWAQVEANLDAGRVKLVFVADVIPRELARIVEFLNDQMRADVRAIELSWFTGKGGVTTLAPRVIGETQRAAAQKAVSSGSAETLTVDEWIDRNMTKHGEASVAGAHAFVKWIESLGATPVVSSTATGGSIQATLDGASGKKVRPLWLWEWGATVEVAFRALTGAGLANEGERLKHWQALNAVTPLSTTNLRGGPGFKVAVLADPAKVAALTPAAEDFVHWAIRGA